MDNLISLVSKANRLMMEYIQKEMEKEGYHFHPSHGNIMINFTNKDSLNYKELSKRINKSPQTMTTLVRKLVDVGLVTIQKDEKDKRNKLVNITDKGRDFMDVMIRISKEAYQKQYIGMEQDADKLKELLKILIHNFE